MELGPGDRFADYIVEKEVGRGGMGVVYLANQQGLNRRVALKVIAPHLIRDDDFRRRFEQEAQSAAAIDHPNVIPIYASGAEDGHLFIAMRYVDGPDLAAVLRSEGPVAEPCRISCSSGRSRA